MKLDRGTLPSIKKKQAKYPWRDMEVGQFFVVPVDPQSPMAKNGLRTRQYERLLTLKQYYQNTSTGKRWALRTTERGYEIHRIA